MKAIITAMSFAALFGRLGAMPASQYEQIGLTEWDLGYGATEPPGSLYICFGLPNMPSTYDCAYFSPLEDTCESLPGAGWPLLEEIRSVSPISGMTCDWWIGSGCGETWSGLTTPPVSQTFPSDFARNPLTQAMGASFRCYS